MGDNGLSAATGLLEALKAKVDGGDICGAKSTLAELKIAMLEFPASSAQHHSVAIAALELGVLLAVADDGDMDSFARGVAQVKTYYAADVDDPPASNEEAVKNKCRMLGLNLMYLLVENRLSEFHAELELLSDAEARSPYVTYPITLERQLMVGSYDEVLRVTTSPSELPDPSYGYFVSNLLHTVRDSIADCMEVAYQTMSLDAARKMMRYDTTEELLGYVTECRDDWIIEGGEGGETKQEQQLCFQPPPVGSKASDVPSMKLISQSLTYAAELERIV